MKLLFAHDHKFSSTSSPGVYSDGKLPYSVWLRYLEFADSVTVIGRQSTEEMKPGTSVVSSGPRVEFRLCPSVAFLHSQVLPWVLRATMHQAVASVDAVVSRVPSRIGYAAIKEAIRQSKPWAIEVVADPVDTSANHGSLLARVYGPWSVRTLRWAAANATHALYVTRNALQARYPASGVQAAVSNVIIPPPEHQVLEGRLKRIGAQAPSTLGLIGNLSMIKGLDTLIECLAQLPESIQVRVLGGGDPTPWQRIARERGVEARIHFDGTLPSGSAVYEWLDGIDIYVQPSRAEGLPRALIEAMSRGCPAVATPVGGIPELLEEDCLHAPGDAEQMASIIRRFLNDPGEMGDAAKRNFEVSKEYGSDVLEQRRREFWQSFADHVAARS